MDGAIGDRLGRWGVGRLSAFRVSFFLRPCGLEEGRRHGPVLSTGT